MRTIKSLLKEVLERACLTVEELSSLLCECDMIVNSRPLCYVSEDARDLEVLTPDLFLTERRTGLPETDLIDAASLNRRRRYRRKLSENLKCRFRKEYLGNLVFREKGEVKPHEFRIGEIVLLEVEDTKRQGWPMARVIQVVPGRDGKIRSLRLKTTSGEFVRPVQRIFPLEIHEDNACRDGQEI